MTTWFVNSAAAGAGTGVDWTNACVSITALVAAVAIAAGDTIKCHSAHAATATNDLTIALPEAASAAGFVSVISVDKNASDAYTAGAQENAGSTTGVIYFQTKGSSASAVCFYGMTFKAPASGSSSTPNININGLATTGWGLLSFSNCILQLVTTGTTSRIVIGNVAATGGQEARFTNCIFKFGSTSQRISLIGGRATFINCSCSGSSATPSQMFGVSNAGGRAQMKCYGCNWSGSTSLVDVSLAADSTLQFYNCMIPATPTTGTHAGTDGPIVECIASAGALGDDTMNLFYYWEGPPGKIETSFTAYLTTSPSQGTGALDGAATPYSYKMTPTSVCGPNSSLSTPWIVKNVAAGSKTFSLQAADLEASPLLDKDLAIEVMYMANAGSVAGPLGQMEGSYPVISGGIARNPLAAGSAMTDTGVAWTGIAETDTYSLAKTLTVAYSGYASARATCHKYLAGNSIYVDGTLTVT